MIYNIILVQEVIHSSREQGGNGMIIKIDMENSLDRLGHNFIFAIYQGNFPYQF